MASAVIAALAAGLTLGFVEALGRFYPSLRTWRRLRVARGNAAVRAMRKRFEAAATKRTPRRLGGLLLVLALAWAAAGDPLLDKRWYELAFDVLPYVVVAVALFRTPTILARIGARMRGYEEGAGWDVDEDEIEEAGPAAAVL